MNNLPRILARTVVLTFGLLFNALAQQEEKQELIAAFDSILSEQFKSNEPGATALVARNGHIIYRRAFGMANLELHVPMRVDNVFRIGSITKQFTAVAILQLMEQGKLSLQDEITKFIPDYPTGGERITIEHLLTHTSGIRDYSSMKDTAQRGKLDFAPREMIDHFKNQPMRFAPGSRWEYSNSGYFVLGYIIEQITGKAYREYIEENFFTPLGMTNSLYASDIRLINNRADGYTRGDHGFANAPYVSMTQPYAAGSIQSTVEDLFTWHQAVHSYKLLKKETLDKALKRFTLTNGNETSYGYGWRFGSIQDSPSIWHGGLINRFITMAMYLPNEDLFVAVFSNCECHSPEDVTAKLAALAIGKPYEYRAISLDNATLAQYTGVYENENGDQRIISASENQLYSQRGRGPKSVIQAFHRDMLFFPDNPMVTITFTRNEQGEVQGLITKSREGNEAWIRTNHAIPSADGIALDENVLAPYVGEYEIAPEFTFVVTRESDRLFLQATGQMRIELFAETDTTFFLRVNDARLTFVRDELGNVTKARVRQSGRTTDAKKIK
jgi:CubicO group peptidase (beta-lactamase class C family)